MLLKQTAKKMANKEGYKDPTAEIAIANVMREQMLKELEASKKRRGVKNGPVKTEKSNKN